MPGCGCLTELVPGCGYNLQGVGTMSESVRFAVHPHVQGGCAWAGVMDGQERPVSSSPGDRLDGVGRQMCEVDYPANEARFRVSRSDGLQVDRPFARNRVEPINGLAK